MTTKSTFQKYYANPEYRNKHNKYCSEKIKCECGTITAQSNLGHHRKTKKHLKWLENNKDLVNINELRQEINLLKKDMKEMKKIIRTSIKKK